MSRQLLALILCIAVVTCEHSPGNVDSETGAADTATSCATDSDLEIDSREVDFGDVPVGDGGLLRLPLSAVGTCPTQVIASTMTNPDFRLSTAPGFKPPFELEAGSAVYWELVYSPTTVGADTGTLLIDSDDAEEPRIEVELTGRGT